MAKRKRKQAQKDVTLPVHGDIGPDTCAQRSGARISERTEGNGARFRSKRRDHVLEIMAAVTAPNGRSKEPELSRRQLAAGMALFEAFCRTELSGEAAFSRPYVQSSPDYDAQVLAKAEASQLFGAYYATIPMERRPIVDHVVLRNSEIPNTPDAGSYRAQLKVALDLLANEMRL